MDCLLSPRIAVCRREGASRPQDGGEPRITGAKKMSRDAHNRDRTAAVVVGHNVPKGMLVVWVVIKLKQREDGSR